MHFGAVIFIFLVSNVLCRRNHHYHYGNNVTHNHLERSQRIATIDVPDNSGFTPYHKHGTGRHVCSKLKPQTEKTMQTYCKPTYKKYMQRCNDNQICTGVKLVFETAYREVYIPTKSTKQFEFSCCPGWTQISKHSHGCNKPVCNAPCENGGTCVRPDHCSCLKGFRGRYCEIDVDECKDQKPCEQICRNTHGSYTCDCREMFVLQPDEHTCKIEVEEGPDTENRDLEFELLDKRLYKLETMLNDVSENVLTNNVIEDINKKVDSLSSDLQSLKNKIHENEVNHRDLRVMKSKIYALETKANAVDSFMSYYDNTKKNSINKRVRP